LIPIPVVSLYLQVEEIMSMLRGKQIAILAEEGGLISDLQAQDSATESKESQQLWVKLNRQLRSIFLSWEGRTKSGGTRNESRKGNAVY
jgi:hypothetical protein